MLLENKIALVTGAGSGLGAAAARSLAAAGANVVLVSRTREELEETAAAVTAAGRQAIVFPADTSDEAAMAELFREIGGRYGRLDIVFANAGVNGVWAPIDDLTPAEWDDTIRINLKGTYLTIHHAVPLMKARGGAIAITASINGTRTFSNGGATAYSVTKAGQLAMGQMLALELARYRIRVNVICPGAIESEISDNTDQRHTDRAKVKVDYPEGKVPLTGGKPGKAEDVADLVVFLSSDAARHITGTPIWIDGAESLIV